ncbi:MAG: CoA transferase, partial [Aestuariivirga sp.]
HPNIVPYQTFETADGYIIIAAGNDRQFAALCKVIGASAIGADARLTTNRGRVELRSELIPALAPYFKTRTTAEWAAALESVAVPCGPINTLDQVFANEQVLARGLVREVTEADGAKVKAVSNPIVFSDSANGSQLASPKLGGQSDQVLRDVLGMTASGCEALRAKGVI